MVRGVISTFPLKHSVSQCLDLLIMTSTVPSYQVWIGGIEHYLNENMIMGALHKLGERPVAVKVMRIKYTGEPAGYGFISFSSEEEAKRVIHKLNGKTMPTMLPNVLPPVRFRLSTIQKYVPSENEFSLWVGDLSPDVNDYSFYKTFACKYQSVRCATVMMDAVGVSRCYGFIRFGSEDEQKHCLTHMNGFKGLGVKPIRISNAHRGSVTTSGGYTCSLDYGTTCTEMKETKTVSATIPSTTEKRQNNHNHESSYWKNYMTWQCYDDPDSNQNYRLPMEVFPQAVESSVSHEDDLDLIVSGEELQENENNLEHNTKLDIESSNKELIQRDYNMWDALECSKWTPVECYE